MTEKKPYTVAVFTAASMGCDRAYADDAAYVGKALAESKIKLVYGGASGGLMNILAMNAIRNGGIVQGYTTTVFTNLFNSAAASEDHQHSSYDTVLNDISSRKREMMNEADAYIIIGGGIGAADELFDAAVEQNLQNYLEHDKPLKPIIVVSHGRGFEKLMDWIGTMIEEGFAHPQTPLLFTKATDGADAVKKMLEFRDQGGNFALCSQQATTQSLHQAGPQ